MPDREKVIKGLEMCLADEYCNGCPYEEDCFDSVGDNPWGSGVMRDALALLKEQPQIVRCKDCKHATIHCIESVLGEPLYDCNNPNWNYDDTPTMLWNWFCADGERKKGR